MDGRSTTLLIALVMAGSALTGCIQNPDWLNTADAEVSAQENRAAANDAALAWSKDAVLVGVMAFELSESPDPRIDADPDPGNGLAPAWWYVYCDEDGDENGVMLRAFKVTADGAVSSERDAEAFAAGVDHETAEPIGAWSVDSDDALAAAKTDEGFAKVAQGFNATVVEGVARYEERSAWWVSAMSADGFVVASVDAVTGELLEVDAMDMDFEMPSFEWGAANPELAGTPVYLEGEDTAKPEAAPLEIPFTASGPMHGTLSIEIRASGATDGLTWWIANDEGEAEGGSVDTFFDNGKRVIEIEIPEAGEYTLAFSHASSMFFLPVPATTGAPVEFTYVLDLMPGMAEHDDEEDEG